MSRSTFLASVLALGALATPVSLSTRDTVAPSCSGGTANPQSPSTYSTTAGSQYNIVCGQQYSGADVASSGGISFASCIDKCDANPDCVNVAYVGDDTSGSCYLKGSFQGGLQSAGNVWTAQKQVVTPPSNCIYDSSDKSYSGFAISCNKDSTGADISGKALQQSSLTACIDYCKTLDGCVAVSYLGGMCYPKNGLTGLPSDANGVATARLNSAVVSKSCVNNKDDGIFYVNAANDQFSIACSSDIVGGDLKAVDTPTFSGCMDACTYAIGCAAAVYQNGRCYLKNSISGGKIASGSENSAAIMTIKIVSAYYGDQDVTSRTSQLYDQNKWSVSITASNLKAMFGSPAPYTQNIGLSGYYSFNMLYTFGGQTRIFTTWTTDTRDFTGSTNTFTVTPGAIQDAGSIGEGFVHAVAPAAGLGLPSGYTGDVKIIAISFGRKIFGSEDTYTYTTMYQYLQNGNSFQLGDNIAWNGDSWYYVLKSGVVWYTRGSDATIRSAASAFDATITFK